MRLRALDFVAYGAFAGETLDLAEASPDLHLVYGPNAAGKSTARTAIGDALFGFPSRTPMAFAIDQRRLRIGFTLERDGTTLRAVRRKGTKQTLLEPGSDTPLDASPLEAWLGHLGRERFELGFALDDAQLRKGGDALLKGGDDIAGVLFAASAGLSRLGERVTALRADAEAAWSPTRRRSRADVAQERFVDATRKLKASRLLAPDYRATLAHLEALEAEADGLRERRATLQRDAAAIQQALLVLEPLARLERARAALAPLAAAPLLPEDAAARVDEATRRLAAIDHALARDTERRTALADEVAGLPEAEPLLVLGAEIDAFVDRAAVVAGAARERPLLLDRNARDRAAAIAALRAADLAWDLDEDAGDTLPSAAALDRVAALVSVQETRAARRLALERRRARAEHAGAQARAALVDVAEPVATTGLEAARDALAAYREGGSDPAAAADALAVARRRVQEAGDRLVPWRGDAATLRLADLPPLAEQERLAAEAEAVAKARQALAERRRDRAAEGARQRAARAELAAGAAVVDEGALDRARADRDALWQGYRTAPSAASAAALTAAIAAADRLADARFAAAERVAKLASLEAAEALLADDLAAIDRDAAELDERRQALARAWDALTAATPMAGVELALAVRWRSDARTAMELETVRFEAERTTARATARLAEVRATMQAALAEHGVETAVDTGLAGLSAAADRTLERARERNAERAAKLEDARVAEAALREIDAELAELSAQDAADAASWTSALATIGVADATPPEAVLPLLAALRTARGHLEAAAERRQRLETAAAEAEALAMEAARLARAAGLEVEEPEAVKNALLGARAAAERRAARRATAVLEVARLDEEIERLEAERAAVIAALAPLHAAARTDDVEGLRIAIGTSAQRSAAEAAVAAALASLGQIAPGDDEAVLRTLVAGRDAIALTMARDEIAVELERAEARLDELRTALAAARLEVEGLADADAAAAAESERQQAAAAMARAIEDHVERAVTARLLQRALDDYRAANETPLLQRASTLFRRLTLGEFQRLTVDYAQGDGVLVAIRPNGAMVERQGFSTGTRDQLYLALRLAALHLYLDRAPALPVVVDDVLVQFSDDRAAAALAELAQLAERTQVLLFTHHRHVVDLAEATLGRGGFRRHELSNALARAADGSGGDERVAEGVARVGQHGLDRDPPDHVDEDRRA